MKSHVVSLELAKQLKEKGYPQLFITSKFWWYGFDGKNEQALFTEPTNYKGEYERICAAPLLTELLENLPSDYLSRTPDEAAQKWLDLHSAT